MSLIQSPKSLTIGVGVAVLVALLLWMLGPVLVPFMVAAVLAYALHPAVLSLQKRIPWLPHTLSVVLIEIFALLVVVGVLFLLIPILTKEIPLLQQQLPNLLDQLALTLNPLLAQFGLGVKAPLLAFGGIGIGFVCGVWPHLARQPFFE